MQLLRGDLKSAVWFQNSCFCQMTLRHLLYQWLHLILTILVISYALDLPLYDLPSSQKSFSTSVPTNQSRPGTTTFPVVAYGVKGKNNGFWSQQNPENMPLGKKKLGTAKSFTLEAEKLKYLKTKIVPIVYFSQIINMYSCINYTSILSLPCFVGLSFFWG